LGEGVCGVEAPPAVLAAVGGSAFVGRREVEVVATEEAGQRGVRVAGELVAGQVGLPGAAVGRDAGVDVVGEFDAAAVMVACWSSQ
jgi:hypothetical protein